jgi:hypothetical protein
MDLWGRLSFVLSERTRNVGVSVGWRTTGTVTNIQNFATSGQFWARLILSVCRTCLHFIHRNVLLGKTIKLVLLFWRELYIYVFACQPRAVAGSCIACWLRGHCVAVGVRDERADWLRRSLAATCTVGFRVRTAGICLCSQGNAETNVGTHENLQ